MSHTGDLAEAYERGSMFLELGDGAGAARLLTPVAAAEPRNAAVRMLLGRACYQSAQLRRAEAEFTAVVELDPADDYARFALGRTLERQSRPAEALPHYRLAAAMRPHPDYLDAVQRVEKKVAEKPAVRRVGNEAAEKPAAQRVANEAAEKPAVHRVANEAADTAGEPG